MRASASRSLVVCVAGGVLPVRAFAVESLTISPEHTASAKLRMADVSALGKTIMFKDVRVARSGAPAPTGGTTTTPTEALEAD